LAFPIVLLHLQPSRLKRGALSELGVAAIVACEHAKAQVLLEESLALSQELDDKDRLGWSLWGLAAAAAQRDDEEEASARYQETLTFFRVQKHTAGIAHTLVFLGRHTRFLSRGC
jgi:hypothetical protein